MEHQRLFLPLKQGMVGVRGFEPPTSASRTQRSTKLSHTPKAEDPIPGPNGGQGSAPLENPVGPRPNRQTRRIEVLQEGNQELPCRPELVSESRNIQLPVVLAVGAHGSAGPLHGGLGEEHARPHVVHPSLIHEKLHQGLHPVGARPDLSPQLLEGGRLELRALYAPDTTGRRRAPPVSTRPPPSILTTGSITRGVVAGSNRDVSVTSALRLSLEGEISPGVALRAALTDEDTPILPEGTTRQLSDLDRVYVEVESAAVRARLGDVDLVLPGTAFAPLARQVQGAVVDARLPAVGIVRGGRVLGSGSATRGRFRSQDLVAVEGVQGPYRLEGTAGEAFVIVVPGSERVYLDGLLLERGVFKGDTKYYVSTAHDDDDVELTLGAFASAIEEL